MFRTVFPSIIRSPRLYIQQQASVKQKLLCLLASGYEMEHLSDRYCCLLASGYETEHLSESGIFLTNVCCCMYSLELLMMDGKTVRNM